VVVGSTCSTATTTHTLALCDAATSGLLIALVSDRKRVVVDSLGFHQSKAKATAPSVTTVGAMYVLVSVLLLLVLVLLVLVLLVLVLPLCGSSVHSILAAASTSGACGCGVCECLFLCGV